VLWSCQPRTSPPENTQLAVTNNQTATKVDGEASNTITPMAITGLEIPKTSASDKIITHTAYSLVYDAGHKQANWVAYELTAQHTIKVAERSNTFKPDPYLSCITASDKEYSGSGYDKGHLAPAADMAWSASTMRESFYFSNVSPQQPGFNRGIWKRLEELVRSWAIEYKAVYVVCGPVLKGALRTIGPQRVSVPQYFYKVVLDYTPPGCKGIGFIMPNTSKGGAVYNYAVPIDSVEKLTDIDFFPLLPEDQERQIESTLCIKCWRWTAVQTQSNKTNTTSVSAQCSATTLAGNRCKRKTLSPNGKCYQHGGN